MIADYKPSKDTTTISIDVKDGRLFKDKMYKKLKKFYIHRQRVIGDRIVFEIRSQRINEFVHQVESWGIKCYYHRFHNLYNK